MRTAPVALAYLEDGRERRLVEAAARDIATIGTAADDRAELLAPGHPLHDAVLRMTVHKLATTLDHGTVLANSEIEGPALMVGVLNEVQDATGTTIAQRFGYVLADAAGAVIEAGPAPYLDYSPPASPTAASALAWLPAAEQDATSWVIAEQLPAFSTDIITRRTAEYERLRDRVRSRLNHEINRLDTEALKADAAAREGRKVRTSGDSLRRRANDLAARLEARLELIEKQLKMAPLPPEGGLGGAGGAGGSRARAWPRRDRLREPRRSP